MTLSAWRRLLAIPQRAVSFTRLGFAPCDAAVRARLERVFSTFVDGYNLALASDDPEEVAAALRRDLDSHHVGFAFEGAGMAYALRDLLGALEVYPVKPIKPIKPINPVEPARRLPRRPRQRPRLHRCRGRRLRHRAAALGRRLWPSYSRRLDPLVSWCLPDGYGFHQGIFQLTRYIAGRAEPPAVLPAFARQLFDSGLGRSLWWSQGAEPARIARAIGAFPPARQPEMWCGIGLAAAYAGGVGERDRDVLLELRDLSGPHRADFLSGVPFATRMRQKGGNPSPVTDRASEILLGRSADEASDWIVETVERVLADERVAREVRLRDSYLFVRRRLVEELSASAQGEPPCRLRQDRRLTTASS